MRSGERGLLAFVGLENGLLNIFEGLDRMLDGESISPEYRRRRFGVGLIWRCHDTEGVTGIINNQTGLPLTAHCCGDGSADRDR